jgi:hypothetical protein
MKSFFVFSFVIFLNVLKAGQPILDPYLIAGSTNDFPLKPDLNITMTFSVKDADPEGHGGAKGDGNTNDAPAIQAWLNKIMKNILTDNNESGGILYFPPGVYKINSTLLIPPRCSLFGLSGFTQSHAWSNDYFKHQSVIIKLADGAECNMVEPYPINSDPLNKEKEYFSNYESVIIEGISLFGNRPAKGGSGNLKGIYLPSNTNALANEDDYYRSNLTIRNVLICNIDGYGFYSEKNNKEYFLDNIISRSNSKDGFYFDNAEDVSFQRVGSGDNGQNGFHFYQSGAMRFTNCDTWGNSQYGLNIEESFGFLFNIMNVNYNFLAGARIMGSGLITFVNSYFGDNSEADWKNPSSPEVDILPNINNYGVYGLKFLGCRFGSMSESNKSLYAVRENSTNAVIRNNAFIGCTFIQKSFKLGICDPQVLDNYIFEGCTGGADGQAEIYNPRAFQNFEEQANISLKEQNHIISIDNNSLDCTVNLPSISSVPVGKEYLIIKSRDNIKLTIAPAANERINNESQLIIPVSLQAFSQIKLLNGGNQWLYIK